MLLLDRVMSVLLLASWQITSFLFFLSSTGGSSWYLPSLTCITDSLFVHAGFEIVLWSIQCLQNSFLSLSLFLPFNNLTAYSQYLCLFVREQNLEKGLLKWSCRLTKLREVQFIFICVFIYHKRNAYLMWVLHNSYRTEDEQVLLSFKLIKVLLSSSYNSWTFYLQM